MRRLRIMAAPVVGPRSHSAGECRYTGREFRPRTDVVRRLAAIDPAPEAQRVVEERLQGLRRAEVGDEGVVVKPRSRPQPG